MIATAFYNDLVNKAYLFAEEKHRGQLYGELEFIHHLLQVYQIIKLLCPEDFELQISAFLHDSYEDTPATEEEITKEFSAEVAQLVKEVTKTKYNTFPHLQSIRGVILLTASRLANMTNMQDWSEEKKREYVFEKTHYWKP